MTILEEHAPIEKMLLYAKEHIDLRDYDPASNTLRKIGEHMAKRLILHAGLWEEARTDENGKQFSDPAFGRCIYLLNKNRIIDRAAYEEVFRPLQKFGNRGSHEVAKVEDYEVAYVYNKTKEYVNAVFLKQFPDAKYYGILPNRSPTARPSVPVMPQKPVSPPLKTTVAAPRPAPKPAPRPAPTPTPKPAPKPHVHTRSGWRTVRSATVAQEGEQQIVCTECGAVLERRRIPKVSIERKPAASAPAQRSTSVKRAAKSATAYQNHTYSDNRKKSKTLQLRYDIEGAEIGVTVVVGFVILVQLALLIYELISPGQLSHLASDSKAITAVSVICIMGDMYFTYVLREAAKNEGVLLSIFYGLIVAFMELFFIDAVTAESAPLFSIDIRGICIFLYLVHLISLGIAYPMILLKPEEISSRLARNIFIEHVVLGVIVVVIFMMLAISARSGV